MVLFAVVAILFFLTRLYHLGTQSFWIDELVSMHFSAHSDWKALMWDNHPPLYHLLLKGWIFLFGTSEFAARSLSVFLSFVAFSLLYQFLLKTRGKIAALTGAAVFILSSLSLLYAQEARMYALFELAATINLICFLKIEENNPRSWSRYLLSALLLAASHYLALIPLGLQSLYFLLTPNRRRLAWRSLGALGFMILLALTFGFHTVSLEWQRLRFEAGSISSQSLRDLVVIFDRSWVCLVTFLSLCLWGWSQGKISRETRFQVATILGSLLLFYFGQFLSARYLFYPRYLIFLSPYIVLVLVSALSWSRLGVAFFVVFATLSFSANFEITKAPWREAGQVIQKNGGGVVFTTRTLAIQTPYLTSASAEAVKLDKESSFFGQVSSRADREDVWILENYWGGLTYLEPLKQELKNHQFVLEDFSLAGPEGESLTLLRVRKGIQNK